MKSTPATLPVFALLALALAGLTSRPLLAEPEAFPPEIAVPRAATPPRLDAAPDDPAWEHAAVIDSLTLSRSSQPGGAVAGAQPSPAPPAQATRVQLLWDAAFLYVRFTCADDDIHATQTGRDTPYSREDVVEVFLDPVGDQRAFIELQLSPNGEGPVAGWFTGGVRDVLYLSTADPATYAPDGKPLPPPTGTPPESLMQPSAFVARELWALPEWTMEGLKTAVRRFGPVEQKAGSGTATTPLRQGWIAELAIPASCLKRHGLKAFQPMTLRANFIRLDYPLDPPQPAPRRFVSQNWSPVPPGRPHRVPAANGYLRLVP